MKFSSVPETDTLDDFMVHGHVDEGPSRKAPIALFDARFQQAAAILAELVSLANAAGVLTNDGSGNLSWGAGGGGGGGSIPSNACTATVSADGLYMEFKDFSGTLIGKCLLNA